MTPTVYHMAMAPVVPGAVEPEWIRRIERVIPRERIRLVGRGDIRIHGDELIRRRIVIAVDEVEEPRGVLVGALESEGRRGVPS